MLLIYILAVIGYCFLLDGLYTVVVRRRALARARAERLGLRANLKLEGKPHV